MAKPPESGPHSDLDGVHQDRRPRNAPENAAPEHQDESDERARDSTARPNPTAEQGRA
jgi:hypothetical protein